MNLRRKLATAAVTAATLLIAGLASTAPSLAVSAATAYRIGSCTATGDYATCDASGSATRPADIYVHVAASPDQQVNVYWDMTCSEGTGAGDRSGSFAATTTVRRLIPHPYARPSSCSVAASVQLSGGGNLDVWLSYQRPASVRAPSPVVYNASSLIRPSSMCLGPAAGPYRCADSLTHLRWSSWGSSAARATGTETWFSSPCGTDGCGAGPATVSLSRVRLNGGAPYYSEVTSVWQQPAGAAHKASLIWSMTSKSWTPVMAVACYPKADDGNCYEPGEFCRTDDLGVTGLAGDGATIKCERYGRGDYPHWKRISNSEPS